MTSLTPLKICQLGHPGLRQIAKPVTDFQDPALPALAAQLLQTMQQGNGVGIAAPQVDIHLAMMIVASRPTPRYPNAPVMEPTVMINPRILSYDPEQVKDWEGCLSVPNQRGLVPRFRAVMVEYADLLGNLHQLHLEDFSHGYFSTSSITCKAKSF
jgi:peptide deformylase